MKIEITSGELAVVLDTLGAEPVSVRYRGVERLWQNENGAWSGHAPVLFPVCGECAAVFGGKRSPMKRHGFARRCVFTPVAQGADFAKFRLTANEETRALYPFEFELEVGYTVRKNELEIAYGVRNLSPLPMPFAWGGHISHALFSPLGEHVLRFSEEEEFRALLHDENGHLTGETADMGRGKELPLPEDVFSGNRTVIFGGVKSRRVVLHNGRGPVAQLSFEGFGNLLLWRPLSSPMICVEPWSALADRADTPADKDLSEKAGICDLPPGEEAHAKQTVAYFEVLS